MKFRLPFFEKTRVVVIVSNLTKLFWKQYGDSGFFEQRGALNREKRQNRGFIRSRIRPPFFPFFYRFFPVFTYGNFQFAPIGPKISAFERNAKAINLLKSQSCPIKWRATVCVSKMTKVSFSTAYCGTP